MAQPPGLHRHRGYSFYFIILEDPKYLRAAVCSDWRWGALPRVCHILHRAGQGCAQLN